MSKDKSGTVEDGARLTGMRVLLRNADGSPRAVGRLIAVELVPGEGAYNRRVRIDDQHRGPSSFWARAKDRLEPVPTFHQPTGVVDHEGRPWTEERARREAGV